MTETVLILGGSLGGLGVVHRLLKYTLPREKDLKVILVSKCTHLYWSLASVRAVVPGLIKDKDIFRPIEPGLAQYPASMLEFILGAATGINEHDRTCFVATEQGEGRAVHYDYLVIATGARAIDGTMPWKASGSYEECLGLLRLVREQVLEAHHIVIAGAGPTGVELAGEIRGEFKNKQVVLLCADQALVHGDKIGNGAERELLKLGVVISKGVRGRSTEKRPDGRTLVRLSNDETIITDLYLPTSGLKPNTDFLPSEWLTSRKYVDVDDYMRIKETRRVWAIGDVVSKPRASFIHTDLQVRI